MPADAIKTNTRGELKIRIYTDGHVVLWSYEDVIHLSREDVAWVRDLLKEAP